MQRLPRVVIVGAGFGGLQAAQSLAHSGTEVLLIDRNNYHTFVPLLYQVAAAQLEPAQIAYPIRTLLRQLPNIHFWTAEVRRMDFATQVVETDSSAISYDFLILATGSQPQFFSIPGAREYALPLKTLEEAVAIRNHVLSCLERAAQEPDPRQRQRLLTFVIVGGGPTGVEVAGALTELIRGPLPKDYPTLDWRQVQVILLQSGNRLLADLPKKLGDYTCKRLHQIGVKVYLQTKVSQVTQEAVHLQENSVIPAATVIWTAGLEAASPATLEALSTATKGKLIVRPTLQLLERPEVYAIGDLAYFKKNGKPLTGVVPEALQQGAAVAQNIKRQMRGKQPRPFSYFNKGRLAIIGCYSGVGQIGGFVLTGFLTWIMCLGVLLVYLPGCRNRLFVLISWIHGYVLRDRAVRLILPSRKEQVLETVLEEIEPS